MSCCSVAFSMSSLKLYTAYTAWTPARQTCLFQKEKGKVRQVTLAVPYIKWRRAAMMQSRPEVRRGRKSTQKFKVQGCALLCNTPSRAANFQKGPPGHLHVYREGASRCVE